MRRLFLLLAVAFFVCIPASARQYANQFGAAVAVDSDEILVGDGRNLLENGIVLTFRSDAEGVWSPSGSVSVSDTDGGQDGFGRALAVRDGLLAVGAPVSRKVYFFERSGSGWIQTGHIEGTAENFGSNLALFGARLLVGAAPGRRSSQAGSAFIYAKNADGIWEFEADLTPGDLHPGEAFGAAVALGNDLAVVGAPGYKSRTGRVFSFRLSLESGIWENMDSPVVAAALPGDAVGSSVLLAGPHLVIGFPGREAMSGAANIFVYQPESNQWQFDRRLAPFDSKGGELFASSLTFSNGALWVGAPGYGDREGSVYRFKTSQESGRMEASSRFSSDRLQFRSGFGGAIAVVGNVGVIGAVGQDNFEGAVFPLVGGSKVGEPIVSSTNHYSSVVGRKVPCEDDQAGSFTCKDVDMTAFLSNEDIGARRGIQVNDVWGWEDPETGREYALVGRTDGTAFVDMTDEYNPVFLGSLPKTEAANQALHRDIKVYKDHAFIVSDHAGPHHMQIFDLRALRNVVNPPHIFEATALYKGIYSAHNVVIDEDAGFAFIVGSDSGGETCGGALHMVNIQDPVHPFFAGCFSDTRTGRGGTGRTHDAQCVVYHGPDADYQGHEICLSSNGTALSIADVTDKGNPVAVSIADYPNLAYTHQGWFTEDQRYFYVNDEGDEAAGLVNKTRTVIFDLSDLDEPEVSGMYFADNDAIDHNLYVKGNLMYQTNYIAGLRILDISNPEKPVEVGYFDTVPYGPNDNSPVLGAWSNYPFFKSGVIVVTSGREGVFFLKKKDVDI